MRIVWTKIAAVCAGSLLVGFGVNFFLVPFHILDGGMIGFSLIVNYLFGFPVGVVTILCSLPIFALAWVYNPSSFYTGIHGLWVSGLLIDLIAPFQYVFLYYIELSPLSSAIGGGLLIGSGLGVMLRNGASTGGIDMLAQIIANHVPLNIGVMIAAADAVVISLGGFLFNADTFLLSAITVVTGGIVTGLLTLHVNKTHA